MKKLYIFSIAVLMLMNMPTLVFASELSSNIVVEILSPIAISDYPGKEDVIKASIRNNGPKDLNEVLVYITMVDVKKNMTVNLEDYNADKPVYIETLKSGEIQLIELPVRFVYTSKYDLYVTAVAKENRNVTSSKSISIEILGNTKINKTLAMSVAFLEPVILLAFVGILYGVRRKKYRVRQTN
ncbi:MAG: hypothetical protein WBA54_08805 [Acidaminobacteraceae bacterium]